MTTQVTTSGSSQSESRTESNEIGVDFGLHDNNDDWHHDRQRGGRDVRDSDLFGSWTLGQENGNTCTIELKNMAWFGGYSAYVPAGCPEGFFSANRWVLSGNQLLLTDTSNTVFGRFHASGGGRWTGYREPDGARLYLNPEGR
ncbi:AprI/Inh family metalloprotease inhibitor [Stenotrophomonas sp. 57]|uniref:AprI/Inh family metalloprotease inhibitor n=1 Tax=Stenotrophomonas sp. 57 TaxID=3051119 RepID=UPI00256EBDF8|nr:AprI/Inh family metalloprotease inhibitor [Stenotrophomonas sp. 57]